ncbi:MAG: 1-deoxy-D-xylulose-5-phosphate reductoisomerase [Omnitrophica bacterium RIFCSPLOWO2_01_FULL_50_24]|nr:MAG: 1-deoxy-D-xylulose-5-phosphate reductoisomerase [Omnitrophica bacterium RIFCSPLOWO2_01_FULL_50_24]
MKHISVIGSTGSIGMNTLRVVRAHSKELKVVALAARRNAKLLAEQAKQFRPHMVCLFDPTEAAWLEQKLKPLRIKVVTGEDGLTAVSTLASAQQIIFALVGTAGLKPILSAIRARKSVAIANKEPLVMAGELLSREAKRFHSPILPIDSEHSGLWQCLEGREKESIKKLILTSSGGPFFRKKIDFRRIRPEQALHHPRWKMGPKITVDSSTLMNKGLEVIEAKNLFEVSCCQIEVLIHPEAVVHALIEFVDGSQLAQLGVTDMRVPIQYALSYPKRLTNTLPSLNLVQVENFHFFKPEVKKFPCLALGYEAAEAGGTMPAVLNAANEVAVERFLRGSMNFTEIPKTIEKVMRRHRRQDQPTLNQILEADRWAREESEVYA